MNKLFRMFALVLLMIIGSQAMAQTRGALFVGASFPMKDYKEFNNFNDFALTSTNASATYGGAGVGFNAGLKWYFNVGVKGLDVLLSLDGFYNGPCKDLKNYYREQEGASGSQILGGSFKYNATPKYINVPLMLGLNYMYHINPNFGVYVEAGAGANLRFITSMESVAKMTIIGVDNQITTTQKYDKAFSFAYQAGIGIEVAQNLVIGCSFYDLGGAAVGGEQTIKTKTLNDNVTTTMNDYREFGTVRPMMILGRIGFSF